MIKSLEDRIRDHEAMRQMCAAHILRVLRDYTDGSDEAERWLFFTPESEEGNFFDEEFNLKYGLTFSRACAILELDPEKLRRKIEGMNKEQFDLMRSILRRSRSNKQPPNEENGEDLEQDNRNEEYELLDDGET